jgi:hypothetical protein
VKEPARDAQKPPLAYTVLCLRAGGKMLGIRHNLTLAIAALAVCAGCGEETDLDRDLSDASASAQATDAAPRTVISETSAVDAAVIDPCRSHCTVAAGRCSEPPPDTYPDLDVTLADWSARCVDAGGSPASALVQARCADGSTLLRTSNGRSSEQRYFAADGRFLSLSTEVDFVDPICRAVRYWPERSACGESEVTRVLCGSGFQVGQVLPG